MIKKVPGLKDIIIIKDINMSERKTYRCSYCNGSGTNSLNKRCAHCGGKGSSGSPPHVQEGREFGSNFPW